MLRLCLCDGLENVRGRQVVESFGCLVSRKFVKVLRLFRSTIYYQVNHVVDIPM